MLFRSAYIDSFDVVMNVTPLGGGATQTIALTYYSYYCILGSQDPDMGGVGGPLMLEEGVTYCVDLVVTERA